MSDRGRYDTAQDAMRYEILAGAPDPLGATLMRDGANFALWSEHAERVELCIFDSAGRVELRRLTLPWRTGKVWHGFVPHARAGLVYGYRVHGPHAPRDGHRFNPAKLLVDPYARDLVGRVAADPANFGFDPAHHDGHLSLDGRDNADFVPKCRLVPSGPPIDLAPRPDTPWRDSIIYELHTKGFTALHPEIPDAQRGTYAALASDAAIRHFERLGVTAIELLPIAAFNDEPHLTAKGLVNYWGYNPFALMAPDHRYARTNARIELAQAVHRLHEHGLEVILDVVFNHTGEGWHLGPTLSFKGIDNAGYYRLETSDRSRYVDHAGCGNTLDMSRPHVRRLLRDALRVWIEDYGIDGFRFDLATTLARGEQGDFSPMAPVFAEFAADPVLSRVKLIGEPWDCAPGGYRLGGFPAPWAEWNDKSRDGMRRFWRGDDGMIGDIARRLSGSVDDMGAARGPLASINYVTAHDGMRLADLVTYTTKRNAANGEDNRDGQADDHGCAYGDEGRAADAAQEATRLRQMKNLIATVLLSQGVPMLAAGDEIGHTQGGNNNPYCQDNAITWIDWSRRDDRDGEALLEFTRQMIALRRRYPILRRARPLTGNPGATGLRDVIWLSPDGREMAACDWELPWARALGVMLAAADADAGDRGPAEHLLVFLNAHDGDVAVRLPAPPDGGAWRCLVDTGAEASGAAVAIALDRGADTMPLAPRSLVLLATQAATDGRNGLTPLDHLAARAGIVPAYHDLEGRACMTSRATTRALLAALGTPLADDGSDDARALREAMAGDWREMLPPVITARHGKGLDGRRGVIVPVAVRAHEAATLLEWSFALEGGEAFHGTADRGDLDILDQSWVDGAPVLRLALTVPLPDAIGYHTLRLVHGERQASCTVIVAPASCFRPSAVADGRRTWGVAHQLYSLRREDDGGIGDFTALAALARAVADRGGGAVGVNPLHALSLAKPNDASPYAPSSRLFINPLYIDLAAVPEARGSTLALGGPRSVAAPRDTPSPLREAAGAIDHAAVAQTKLAALALLFERFGRDMLAGAEARAADFARFVAAGGERLQRFAEHQVLEEELGRADGPAWDAYRDPSSPACRAFAKSHARRILFHCWLQFEAERQLAAARVTALEGSFAIGFYGDLAVGVDPLGADVWSEPEAFVAAARIGAPPDQFSREGQEWGLLPFSPRHLRASAYRPFVAMLRAAMRHCGAVRIDHVMWLERAFLVPAGGRPADGAYVRYPREELMAVLALESHRNACLVVGEDLGTVPSDFRAGMAREQIFSYKLMRFERHDSGLYARPELYAPAALATTASHDLPTLAGFWSERDIDVRVALGLSNAKQAEADRAERARERHLLVAALADQGLLAADFPTDPDLDASRLHALIAATHLFLSRTPSGLLMLNIEDLAASTAQVNLPGPLVGYPCWRIRMEETVAQIMGKPWVEDMLATIAAERPDGCEDRPSF